MATLDTNKYQLPSFTKIFEAQREKREAVTEETGAETTFTNAKYSLQGDRLAVANAAYELYEDAATRFERTGSTRDREEMQRRANDLNFYAKLGMQQQAGWNQTYAEAEANQFQGYAESGEQIRANYQSKMNRNAEVQVINGEVMIKEGDKFVPARQSSFYSAELNPNNTFYAHKSVEGGKYVIPESYAATIQGVLASSPNIDVALEKAQGDFQYRLKHDREFLQDVAVHYAINDLKILDGRQGLLAKDIAEAMKRISESPEMYDAAVQSYWTATETNLRFAHSEAVGSAGTEGFLSYPSYISELEEGGSAHFRSLPKKVSGILAIGEGLDAAGNPTGEYYVKRTYGEGIEKIEKAKDSDIPQVEAALGINIRGVVGQEAEQEPKGVVTKENPMGLPGFGSDFDPGGFYDLDPAGAEETGLKAGTPAGILTEEDKVAAEDSELYQTQLPNWYYGNLIEFEGGISTDKDDNAYDLNPDAPTHNGGRAHTNRGVQYQVFKTWAEEKGIPKSQWHKRFLNLREVEAKQIADGYTRRSGAIHFESEVLRSLFTQNSWGTGKVWAADFKPGRSKEYRALLDWLQSETGLDFKNVGKMSKAEAAAIERVYNKNPKKFINTFAANKRLHFSTLDDYGKYGRGWERRLEDLRKQSVAAIS